MTPKGFPSSGQSLYPNCVFTLPPEQPSSCLEYAMKKSHKNSKFDTRTEVDWSNALPLGVTPPLFAECLQVWFRNENPEAIKTLLQAVEAENHISVQAAPPSAVSPWHFVYRALSADPLEDIFRFEPEAMYFASSEFADRFLGELGPPEPYELSDRGRRANPLGGADRERPSEARECLPPTEGSDGAPTDSPEDRDFGSCVRESKR